MKLRTQQLLKLYHKSYTRKKAWKAERIAAIQAQHPKAALKADTAAHYWDSTKNKLYVSLLIASPL